MKPELQRRVQRYGWDKAAPYYENGWLKQLWPAQEKLLQAVQWKPGNHVLDVSCGTGLVTFPIAKAVSPGGLVTAIDISEGMIEKAENRAQVQNFNNITFRRMDAEALELPDASFDTVICSLGLMYFPDPEKALSEMLRVLKPGGQLASLVWGERKNCGWAGVFPIVDRRVKTDVCPLFFQLGTASNLQNAYEKVGLVNCSTSRFNSPLLFNDGEEACVSAFWGGAVALAYQKFDEQTRNEANEEYLKSIRSFQNGKGYSIPGEFVIVKGVKSES